MATSTISKNHEFFFNDLEMIIAADLNNLFNTNHIVRIVRTNSSTLNIPADSFTGFCIHCQTTSLWGVQLAMRVGDDKIYTRALANGTWSNWSTK